MILPSVVLSLELQQGLQNQNHDLTALDNLQFETLDHNFLENTKPQHKLNICIHGSG